MLIYSQRIITKESAFNIIWGVLWSENQAQPINISSFGQKKIHSRLVYCRGKGNPRVSHGFFHGYGYENPDPRKTPTRGCGYGFSNSEPARRHFFSQTANTNSTSTTIYLSCNSCMTTTITTATTTHIIKSTRETTRIKETTAIMRSTRGWGQGRKGEERGKRIRDTTGAYPPISHHYRCLR